MRISPADDHTGGRGDASAPRGRAPARPRIVATDLDGTLLRSDGSVSDRTRAALRAVDDVGLHVIFVTARPPRWLPDLSNVIGSHGHVICLGGACLLDAATGRAVESDGFDDGVATDLVADLRLAVPGIALGLERISGAVYDTHFPHDEPVTAHGPRLAPVEDSFATATDPVAKLLARSSAGADADLFATVTRVAGDRAHLAYSGAVGLAELLAPRVTKAAALARWCATLGVAPADVWAFGDMPNDLPMLRWAGRSYAVDNAHPDVLTATTHRTTTNDDDGVARVLERLLDA